MSLGYVFLGYGEVSFVKVGLITNLQNNNEFVSEYLWKSDASAVMKATGGNTGNVAFVHSVKNILMDDFEVLSWGHDPVFVNKNFDLICVCCANQVGSHVDLKNWGDALSQFDLPVVLIGLGAQSDRIGVMPEVPEGTREFLEIVSHLKSDAGASNIITRGEFSSWVLKELGYDTSPLGCPSLLTSPRSDLGQECYKRKDEVRFPRVMVPSGNPWHPSSKIEGLLVELVEKFNGEYVLQHPDLLFKLVLEGWGVLDERQSDRLKSVYNCFGSLGELEGWLRAYSVFFADAQNWLNYSRKFSVAVGPRYHGVALPVQMGVPGRVVTIDSRTEELAKTTGIPCSHFSDVEGLSAEELYEAAFWSRSEADNFDAVRCSSSSGYINFFKSNGLSVKPYLADLARG
ncbi:polysaccharide pyruvyl transferase family protein [Microbulbifer rhizosphaerae]|uniref:Polysaccharide pyruvyl transferase domain-containing protein n=1 Tax=Microbulbifer rhizosphaerae TaxID=1562603 RepID=A0A7W4Z9J2_9GAMM|nr:polysaccharide pyruvyl transferase family protein [Microbulbifer rhizosphaerae]MBB3061888.1 hypothetical protein [Microbulbifer rhizosphaerae]